MTPDVLPLSPEEIEEVRTFGRASLFFFAKYILGYKDLTEGLHRTVCEFVQSPDQFKLLELPRGHLKTTIATIAHPLWETVTQPDGHNLRWLIRNAVEDNAKRFLREIAWHFERNARFRQCYPEALPPDFHAVKWNDEELEIPRTLGSQQATFTAAGIKTTVVSGHYDRMIHDDFINEDHDPALSPGMLQKAIEAHKGAVGLMVDPATTKILVVGNRWYWNDLNAWVRKEQPYYRVFERAVTHDGTMTGTPIWPERFPGRVIDQLLETLKPRKFSAWYMNRPTSEDSRSFDPSWIRTFREIPDAPLRYYAAVDPAISTSQDADPRAVVVLGIDPDYSMYVVEARQGRWGVDEFIDQLFDVDAQWPQLRIGFEADGYQRLFFWPIREAMRRHQRQLTIVPLSAIARGKKQAHIETLHEYFNNGSLWLREGLDDLREQLAHFPWAGGHDDLLDALAYAVRMARPPGKAAPPSSTNPFLIENILTELRERHTLAGRKLWAWHGTTREVTP